MKKYAGRFAELKALDVYVKQAQPNITRSLGYYKNLMLELIELDARFALHCDVKDLAQSHSLRFKKLTDPTLRKQILERLGGEAMPNLKTYAKYFPELIEYMNDIDDVKSALMIDASAYKNINDYIKSLILKNSLIYFDLFMANSLVIKYLSDKELIGLLNDYPVRIGYFIAKHPEVLLNLPAGTFTKYNISIMFQNINKNRLYLKLADMGILEALYTKFPEFKDYFGNDLYRKNTSITY